MALGKGYLGRPSQDSVVFTVRDTFINDESDNKEQVLFDEINDYAKDAETLPETFGKLLAFDPDFYPDEEDKYSSEVIIRNYFENHPNTTFSDFESMVSEYISFLDSEGVDNLDDVAHGSINDRLVPEVIKIYAEQPNTKINDIFGIIKGEGISGKESKKFLLKDKDFEEFIDEVEITNIVISLVKRKDFVFEDILEIADHFKDGLYIGGIERMFRAFAKKVNVDPKLIGEAIDRYNNLFDELNKIGIITGLAENETVEVKSVVEVVKNLKTPISNSECPRILICLSKRESIGVEATLEFIESFNLSSSYFTPSIISCLSKKESIGAKEILDSIKKLRVGDNRYSNFEGSFVGLAERKNVEPEVIIDGIEDIFGDQISDSSYSSVKFLRSTIFGDQISESRYFFVRFQRNIFTALAKNKNVKIESIEYAFKKFKGDIPYFAGSVIAGLAQNKNIELESIGKLIDDFDVDIASVVRGVEFSQDNFDKDAVIKFLKEKKSSQPPSPDVKSASASPAFEKSKDKERE